MSYACFPQAPLHIWHVSLTCMQRQLPRAPLLFWSAPVASSYCLLSPHVCMYAPQRLESPSKVYGGGLRSAEQKWRQLGGDRQAFNRVLEHVRVHQSF